MILPVPTLPPSLLFTIPISASLLGRKIENSWFFISSFLPFLFLPPSPLFPFPIPFLPSYFFPFPIPSFLFPISLLPFHPFALLSQFSSPCLTSSRFFPSFPLYFLAPRSFPFLFSLLFLFLSLLPRSEERR